MGSYKINQREQDALRALPWRVQVLYHRLRADMDFKAGSVRKRWSDGEAARQLTVPARQGRAAEPVSRHQARDDFFALVSAGLLDVVAGRKLLPLADRDDAVNRASNFPQGARIDSQACASINQGLTPEGESQARRSGREVPASSQDVRAQVGATGLMLQHALRAKQAQQEAQSAAGSGNLSGTYSSTSNKHSQPNEQSRKSEAYSSGDEMERELHTDNSTASSETEESLLQLIPAYADNFRLIDPAIPVRNICIRWNWYARIGSHKGRQLVPVRLITNAIAKSIRETWGMHALHRDLGAFEEIFARVVHNTFLNGDREGAQITGRGVTFDWIIKPDNFAKVAQGNYAKYHLQRNIPPLPPLPPACAVAPRTAGGYQR